MLAPGKYEDEWEVLSPVGGNRCGNRPSQFGMTILGLRALLLTVPNIGRDGMILSCVSWSKCPLQVEKEKDILVVDRHRGMEEPCTAGRMSFSESFKMATLDDAQTSQASQKEPLHKPHITGGQLEEPFQYPLSLLMFPGAAPRCSRIIHFDLLLSSVGLACRCHSGNSC